MEQRKEWVNKMKSKKLSKAEDSSKIAHERKVEQGIHKAITDLQLLTGIYIGERQIARGDAIPQEEVWKKLKEKFKFKIDKKSRENIKQTMLKIITEDVSYSYISEELTKYVVNLLEKRDELFKRKHPRKYPSPYPNQY